MEKLKSCPLCGESVKLYEEKSPDGTITWGRIMHGPLINCGISFIDDIKDIVEKWNKRTKEAIVTSLDFKQD